MKLSYDQQRANDLALIAEKRLGKRLSVTEKALIADSTSSDDFIGPIGQPQTAKIDASFLRWMATDSNAAPLLDAKGIRLRSTTVFGDLDLNNCRLSTSLGFRTCIFDGEILLDSTRTRNIEFHECTFHSAIKGGNATVEGSLYINNSVAFGEIALERIGISGDLSLAGLSLQNQLASVYFDGAKINGSVLLTDGFKTLGSIQMHNARMGDFDCSGAVFFNANAVFSLDGIAVAGDLSLSHGFSCLGTIRLPGARISGNLECINAEFGTLICHNMVVEADLMWVDIQNADRSELLLIGAKVKGFRDQKASWPKTSHLALDGFVYEHLTMHKDSLGSPSPKGKLPDPVPFDSSARIDWINLQSEDRAREAQPWMQLVKVAQALGHDRGARHVLYQLACRRSEKLRQPLRRANRGFAWLREQPFRISWPIGGMLFVATILFLWAGSNGAVAPRDKDAYSAWSTGKPFPAAYPRFNPLIYSLENELPLVKLGQDDRWTPDPSHRPVPFRGGHLFHWTWIFDSYGFLSWARWIAIGLGWVQATVLAAALANRFRS